MHITPSEKRYIGITSIKPQLRWQGGRGYINNKHFYNAIQKYGWRKIEHLILETGLSEEEAKEKEIELIAEYGTQDSAKGYNKTEGGDTNIPLIGELNGMFGKHHTADARKQMSEAATQRFLYKENHPMYGIPRSEETKHKLSVAHKGKSAGQQNYFYGKNKSGMNAWRYGTKHTDETKRKLSEIRKGKYTGEKAYNAKPIRCVETGEVFTCAVAAADKYGYDNSTIGKCCKGTIKSAYGFHWEYN